MVQRYEAVGSILNRWYLARAHHLPWPDELMQPATDTASAPDLPGRAWSLTGELMQRLTDSARLTNARNAVEADWEKDWIDIGGEG